MLRQLERRREREAAARRRNLIISIVGAVVVIGLVVFFIVQTGSDDTSTAAARKSSTTTPSAASSSPAASSSSAATVAPYPCTWTKSGTAAKKATVPSTTKPPRTGTADVTLATTQGTIRLALDRKAAPCAVGSFVSLAEQGYFNSTPCHRLVTSGIFVLQCGDPSGTGSGGPGYSFGDELTTAKYTRGTLAMANSGANTNGSQFFIVYKDSLQLPPSYTIFGKVTAGLGVVDKVAAKGAATGSDGKPKLPIAITKASVAR